MKTIRTLFSASSVLLVLALASTTFAQQIITYQGSATQNGAAVTGPHGVTVSIYTVPTGGTAIWTENGNVNFSTGGIFDVSLGLNSANPLPQFDAGGNSHAPGTYYLGVAIDGNPELTPRGQLGASPTSWTSRYADSTRVALQAMSLASTAGVVTSINTLSGDVVLQGGGGTTINKSGQTITISSSGGGGSGIQGVQNTDGTLSITNPNGPTATINVVAGGIGTGQLAASAVTTAKIATAAITTTTIANNAVTAGQIGSGSATNGQVLTANGTGGVSWLAPSSSGLTLPYSATQTSSSTLFSLTNLGTGYAINCSAGGEIAIQGQSTASLGVGVVGRASDGSTISVPSGVCGTSDTHTGVAGNTQTGYGVDGFASSLGVGVHGTAGAGATTARAGLFETYNSAASGNTVEISNGGMGNGLKVTASLTTNANPVVLVQSPSTVSNSVGIQGEMTSAAQGGFSAAVYGLNDGTSGNGIGVYGKHNAGGWGVFGSSVSGLGVYGFSSTSIGVYAASTNNAFEASYSGSGTSSTTANNIAIFQNGGTNKARIDNTGKGFFDGGTQNSGADVAEEFDVNGNRASYTPGDVLVIAKDWNRTVEKSSEPYSRLVAGVYATRPGVTLTNTSVEADLSGKVPMGVIGVIPTKVTSEGGPIEPGDLLVTSSTCGCAMKADLAKLQIGQAFGKALAHFDGKGVGTIEVLVGKY